MAHEYSPFRSRKLARLCLLSLSALAYLLFWSGGVNQAIAGEPGTITNYIDPAQKPAWSLRSYWKQPWRSYMDTVPATTLLDAIGINFNIPWEKAANTARLLGESGFRRARLEYGWGGMSYDDPDKLDAWGQSTFETQLRALKDNGLRPLILLNANHGKPCPIKPVTLSLALPAAAGATQVQLDPTTIDPNEIVLRRTGITDQVERIAAARLFTSVNADGLAHLSKPLQTALPAGPVEAVTLRFEPFTPSTLPDGSPNPLFRQTLDGWLEYVQAVTHVAKSTLGSEDFDVEIWNELSFGSNFLNINRYYEPDEYEYPSNRPIIEETVKLLRDPARGVPNVGIGNGFASQSPHGVGVEGIAIDKHPYFGTRYFPESKDAQTTRPTDGTGALDGVRDSSGRWHDTFTPTFVSSFPEYPLNSIQTESLIYDLAPYETLVGAERHGRSVIGPGGTAPSPMWVTEVNLAPTAVQRAIAEITPVDTRHIETKIVLRYLASFINKGVTVLDFYAATGGDLGLIDRRFIDSLRTVSSPYPGIDAGGETMAAVRRLTEGMAGAQPIGSPRQLSLDRLTDFEGNVQFEGDGTVAHPPLYNRDVLAFLPFQVNAHRFVVPTYVMTRNITEVYDTEAPNTDPSRFDLPQEPYEMVIGGVKGTGAQVSAVDPVTGASTPVHIVKETGSNLTVQMEVTDSPRLLTIQENGNPEGTEEEAKPEPEGETPPPTDEEGPGHGEFPPPSNASGKPAPTWHGIDEKQGKDTKPLNIALKVGSTKTLMRQRRVIVLASCDHVCTLSFQGKLTIAGKQAPMRIAAHRPSVNHPDTGAAAYLTISGRASRAARTALERDARIRVTIGVTATTDDGAEANSSRTLPVTLPAKQRRRAKAERSDRSGSKRLRNGALYPLAQPNPRAPAEDRVRVRTVAEEIGSVAGP